MFSWVTEGHRLEKVGTGIPYFLKVCIMLLCFAKPTLAPISVNQKKFADDSHIYKKR